jgi:hypothetical protein
MNYTACPSIANIFSNTKSPTNPLLNKFGFVIEIANLNGLLRSSFQIKILYIFFISFMHADFFSYLSDLKEIQ